MKLDLSGTSTLDNPSSAQIAQALAQLITENDSFAVLSITDQTFIQTCRAGPEGFVVEYRDGCDEQHFESVDRTVRLKVVIDIFQRYAAADPRWKDLIGWQPWGTHSAPSPGTSRLIKLLGMAAIAAGLYFLWRHLGA